MDMNMILKTAETMATEAAESTDMMENLMDSFQIMGQGMAGIFVTIIIIMLVVWTLAAMDKKSAGK